MMLCMFPLGRENNEIIRIIVAFVPIDMVYNFSLPQRTTKHLLCYTSVLMPTMHLTVSIAFAFITPSRTELFSNLWCHPKSVDFPIHFGNVRTYICIVFQIRIALRVLFSVAISSKAAPTTKIVGVNM